MTSAVDAWYYGLHGGFGCDLDPQERYRRTWRLCQDPDRCLRCDAPLDADVWRIQHYCGWMNRGLGRNMIVPVCFACARLFAEMRGCEREFERLDSMPCAACGRPVIDTWRLGRRVLVACGELCRTRAHSSAYRARRQARVTAGVRLTVDSDVTRRLPCARCGEPMPDAHRRRYCSSACRQAAYRERKAAGPVEPEPVDEDKAREAREAHEQLVRLRAAA